METSANSHLEDNDPRFNAWQNLARRVIAADSLSDFLSPKIVEIECVGAERFLTYKPLKENQKTFKIMVDTDDLRAAGIATLANGQYEPGVEAILASLVSQTRVFIDIGANVGFYSCFAAALNETVKVFSFEPNSDVRKRLHKNIMLNNSHDRIAVLPYGLGERNEELELYVPPRSGSGAGSLRNLHPEEGESVTLKVDIHKLSSIFPNLDSVDLLKIDIEGSELAAIKGGLELIQRNKPVIIVELLRKWMKPFGSHPQDVVKLLTPFGYTCFSIAENGILQIDEIDENTSETNFLFVPDKWDFLPIEKFIVKI
jgi:FkbM family methyltransferase